MTLRQADSHDIEIVGPRALRCDLRNLASHRGVTSTFAPSAAKPAPHGDRHPGSQVDARWLEVNADKQDCLLLRGKWFTSTPVYDLVRSSRSTRQVTATAGAAGALATPPLGVRSGVVGRPGTRV
jgi:hypothetical protein